ncbi:uncharacterized protein LOC126751749 [Bactrocera neohumeralis]|uniref:uncharacterized protein LOC126751749 n=1 Tax=Bactrocera neohumeralis TaxID=98809 RepID=UPI0021662E71|nr:uncharacterized protein LOC126751749 [Bactrocera neohumeralis]
MKKESNSKHRGIYEKMPPLNEVLRVNWNLQIISCIVVLFTTHSIQLAHCIDCFKCVSFNGANKACDDPFHNNYSTAILESPCMGGRKGRNGLFPTAACIKIAGIYDDDLILEL